MGARRGRSAHGSRVGESPLKNLEVARVLNRIADLLEFTDENPFKVRAYRRAAETLTGLVEDVAGLAARGTLTELPGVGKDLAVRIQDIVTTGTCEIHEKLRSEIPAGLLALTALDGMGPKTARLLWKALGVDSLQALEAAAQAQKVRGVKGMGPKKEEKILQALEKRRAGGGRVPFYLAHLTVYPVLRGLQEAGFRTELAGSMRRWRETVADADLLVASDDPEKPTKEFLRIVNAAEVLGSGDTKTSIRTADGFQIDLRVVPPEVWGAALLHFTGSKEHNVRLRQMAIAKGCRLSEYGLVRERDGVRLAGATEEEVYEALGLPWIPPEIREDHGEIEAALAGKLPDLIELTDIQGDCHAHTTESDGAHPLDELARAARAKGYRYLVVTDHTQSLTIAHGLDPARLERQLDAIARWNAENGDESFRVLSGSEVDILDDGSLDLPDECLEKLDFVVASLHGNFKMPREKMTARVVKALSSPHVDVMGHPTTRLVGDRDPVDFDFDAVLAAAKSGRTAMELNASANRMDLSAPMLEKAKAAGVKVVISTDAHRLKELDQMAWGVHQARRAWIEKKDVLNALPREEFLRYVRGAGVRPGASKEERVPGP